VRSRGELRLLIAYTLQIQLRLAPRKSAGTARVSGRIEIKGDHDAVTGAQLDVSIYDTDGHRCT
jgi:hypothetical protein